MDPRKMSRSTSSVVLTNEPTFGEMTSITDPLSHTTHFTYDDRGNRIGTTDALNHTVSRSYNGQGLVTSVTDALQNVTRLTYGGGDLVALTDALQRTTRRFLDGAGRILSQTDPDGQVSQMAYDRLNHVTSLTDALGATTAYTYDSGGRLSAVTDARTHSTTYGWDAFDRVTGSTDAVGAPESVAFDLNGNPIQQIDRRGQVTSRTYDSVDRLHQITYPDGSTVTYGYDAGDRATSIVDSVSGTISRAYDGLDRLTSETTPQGRVDYTYDAGNRRATMTILGQPTVTYVYDDANRLTSVTQGTSSVTLTYNDANRRSTVVFPNGVSVQYDYDAASQLTQLTYRLNANTLGNVGYTYDMAGRRIEMSGSWARTALPAAVTTTAYDSANRLTQWGAETLNYDANGNLTSDGPNSYSWNARDQLSTIGGGLAAAFQYDSVGRRTTKNVSGTSTSYVFDGSNTVQELTAGSPSANILTGMRLDERFVRTSSEGTQTILRDALGSTLALLDDTGDVTTEYSYDPFGATVQTGQATLQSAQYTGRDNDDTGLYFYRARYYLPEFGRFISEDPIAFATSMHRYAYVDSDPIDWADPLGLWHCVGNANCDFTPTMQSALDCFDRCSGHDTAITSGRGNRATNNSSHSRGEACDIGRNSNPALTRQEAERCFGQCFPNGYGQVERNGDGTPGSTPGTHIHIQEHPIQGGRPGFAPGIQPYTR
jgi:RHS repeat-associated protein